MELKSIKLSIPGKSQKGDIRFRFTTQYTISMQFNNEN